MSVTDALFSRWIVASLMMTLRIGPVFAFAPPFTLVRLPKTVRLLLCLTLSVCLAERHRAFMPLADLSAGTLIPSALMELALGMVFVMALQLLFAAINFACRTVDLQAGFGLASLIDPVFRSPVPLLGTFFAYLAGFIFFAAEGHWQLYKMLWSSFEYIPVGGWEISGGFAPASLYISVLFSSAVTAAGTLIITFFLIDLAIAFLSRTVPQMNVLFLGFEVKAVAFLLAVPGALALALNVMAGMIDFALGFIPRLL